MSTGLMFRVFVLAVSAAMCLAGWAQEESTSVAEAAKASRQSKKAQAKAVLTEESLAKQEEEKGPIPALKLEGHDNVDEIVQAIEAYKDAHTPEETEGVVRDWYRRYEEMRQRIWREDDSIISRQDALKMQPKQYPRDRDDYARYQERMRSDSRAAAEDKKVLSQNLEVVTRIRTAFSRISSDLSSKYQLRYDWFSVWGP